MFRKLLNPESGLMMTLSKAADWIFLSLFWFLGCIPVVTAGASFAALYDSSFRAFRQREKHSWARFWQVYRRNLLAGILPTAIFGAVLWGATIGTVTLWNNAVLGKHSFALFSAGAIAAVVLLGILSVLFPMLSRFENSFMQLLKNTFVIAMANLPRTLVLGLMNGFAGFLCLSFIFPLFFLPSVVALLDSFLIEPMFQPYLPEAD